MARTMQGFLVVTAVPRAWSFVTYPLDPVAEFVSVIAIRSAVLTAEIVMSPATVRSVPDPLEFVQTFTSVFTTGTVQRFTCIALFPASGLGYSASNVFASPGAMRFVRRAFILPEVTGSDHCPVGVVVDNAILG